MSDKNIKAEAQSSDADDVLRRLLAMPPQPKKGKEAKDKPASK